MSDEDRDDLLGDLLMDELDDDDGSGSLPTNEDIGTLRNEIENLTKERHGLLKNIKEERRKRQELSGKLGQLTETVNAILSAKQRDAQVLDGVVNKPNNRIPVEFDDDGEGYLPAEKLTEVVAPYQSKIQQLEQALQLTSAQQDKERAAQQLKESIVGEDESYAPAYRRYQAARKWVEDQVKDFAYQNGINRYMSSGEALDYVFNEDLQNEFESQFPGLPLDDIVTAEDSQRHFRRTLSTLAKALAPADQSIRPEGKPLDGRFQKVLRKPSGLGNQANAKAGQLSIAEKVSNLSSQDLMELSDQQIEALERALRNEEKEGIEF